MQCVHLTLEDEIVQLVAGAGTEAGAGAGTGAGAGAGASVSDKTEPESLDAVNREFVEAELTYSDLQIVLFSVVRGVLEATK
jgi:hypothetical protein